MELQELRCFVAVAEERHFGRAADFLHLSASPVSRAVRKLERELGGELFVRSHHHVELTALGEELVPLARRVLEDTEQLAARATALVQADAPRGIHLGVSPLCPPAISDAVVELLRQELPDRRVDIEFAPAAQLLPVLGRGRIDLAIAQLPVGQPEVSELILAKYQVWVVTRADDPLAGRSELRLRQLAGRTLTLGSPRVEPAAMAMMMANLRAQGVTDLVEMPEFDHVKLAAEIRHRGGLALTLHPSTGGSHRVFDDPAFGLIPITDTHFTFAVGVVWRTDVRGLSAEAVAALRAHWTVPASL